MRTGGQSTSLDSMLDALMDLSVAALVCPGPAADAEAGGVALAGWPAAMRSPSGQRGAHAAHDMAAVPNMWLQQMATIQEA